MIIWVFAVSPNRKEPKSTVPRSALIFPRESPIAFASSSPLVAFFQAEMKINIIFVISSSSSCSSFSPLETMQLKSNYILPMVVRSVRAFASRIKISCSVKARKWYLSGSCEQCRSLRVAGDRNAKKIRRTFNSWNSSSDLFSPKHVAPEKRKWRNCGEHAALDVFSGVSSSRAASSRGSLYHVAALSPQQRGRSKEPFLTTTHARLTASNFYLISFHLHLIAFARSSSSWRVSARFVFYLSSTSQASTDVVMRLLKKRLHSFSSIKRFLFVSFFAFGHRKVGLVNERRMFRAPPISIALSSRSKLDAIASTSLIRFVIKMNQRSPHSSPSVAHVLSRGDNLIWVQARSAGGVDARPNREVISSQRVLIGFDGNFRAGTGNYWCDKRNEQKKSPRLRFVTRRRSWEEKLTAPSTFFLLSPQNHHQQPPSGLFPFINEHFSRLFTQLSRATRNNFQLVSAARVFSFLARLWVFWADLKGNTFQASTMTPKFIVGVWSRGERLFPPQKLPR